MKRTSLIDEDYSVARFLVSFIVGLISFSAFGSAWDGSYSISSTNSNDGIDHCSAHIALKTTANEKGEVQEIELSSDLDSKTVFKNDLNFRLGHNGFYGYNRFGGRISAHEATRITTTTSFAAATVFLPYHSTFGQRLSLSTDGRFLTLRGHDTTYGYGTRYSCLYQRD